ncbi:MAG: DNA-binding protein [Deltaproteobacteria bacterium]|nr:DNA-binding protein [Deltaproteobacteria bacterium]
MRSLPSPVSRLLSSPTLLFALLLTVSGCAAHPTAILSIAQARQLKPGALVSVGGSVTVPAGLFQSSTADEGFALQDPSGGIYVSLPVNTGAEVGQTIGVTGQLSGNHGQLTIVPAATANVVKLSSATAIEPQAVATGKVNETTLGRLLRISGQVSGTVRDDLPYGYKFTVDDGSGAVQVFVHTSTAIDVGRVHPGEPVTIVGFGGLYERTYEVLPRFANDVQITPPKTKKHAKARSRSAK